MIQRIYLAGPTPGHPNLPPPCHCAIAGSVRRFFWHRNPFSNQYPKGSPCDCRTEESETKTRNIHVKVDFQVPLLELDRHRASGSVLNEQVPKNDG